MTTQNNNSSQIQRNKKKQNRQNKSAQHAHNVETMSIQRSFNVKALN